MKKKDEILVVDDDETIVHLLSALLRDEGYSVTPAFRGDEALVKLRAQPYQLILLDLVLPDARGIDLLREIRATFPKIDVIIMTSHASIETAVEALRLGAYDYLFKPFDDLEVVSHAVSKTFDKRQALEENERLHQELKAKTADLESYVMRLTALNDAGRSLHSILNKKEIFSFTLQLVATELKAKRASLMLLDKATNELVIEASVGLDGRLAKTIRVPVGVGIAGWVAQEGKALLVEDIEQDYRFKNQRDGAAYDSNSFISAPLVLSVPIHYQKKLIGVININNKEDGGVFTKSDLAFVSTLANQAAIAIENARIFEKLKEAHMEAITALAEALEAKDATTAKHSHRILHLAMQVADRLRLDEDAKEILRYAAVLHDIGKIGIAERILLKTEQLTPEETEEIKKHPRLGATLVKKVAFLSAVAPIILAHHEWYNGRGYPEGLSGDAIPIEARVVAVMDSYDAMTTDRPYKKAQGKEYAIKELKAYAGSQFDPRVVDAFLSVLEEDEKASLWRSSKNTAEVSLPAEGRT